MANLLKTWQDVAHTLGAEFAYSDNREDTNSLEEISLRVSHRKWLIEFTSKSKIAGKDKAEAYTRIHCSLQNPHQFQFNIYEQELKHRLFKIIGLQDIPISDPDLDKRYIVQANDEQKIQQLLHLPLVRAVFASPFIQHLRLTNKVALDEMEKSSTDFQLYGRTERRMTAKAEILAHFQLFAATLDCLSELQLVPD